MISLGYNYDEIGKCYYTDAYERSDVVSDRNSRLLVDYFSAEKRIHRWIQISEVAAKVIEDEHTLFPRDCFYSYLDK